MMSKKPNKHGKTIDLTIAHQLDRLEKEQPEKEPLFVQYLTETECYLTHDKMKRAE